MAARYLSDDHFGVFATSYLVFTIVLGIERGLVTEPALANRRPAEKAKQHVLSSAIAVGLAGSAAVFLVGVLLGGELRDAFLVLAIALPLILAVDAGRYIAFAELRPGAALSLDIAWAGTQFLALSLVVGIGPVTPASVLAAWGISAGSGLLLLTGGGLRPHPSFTWLREVWPMAWRYAGEWMVGVGASTIAVLLLGPVAGIAAVGSVRAAQVIFGPLTVLFSGVLAVLVPEGNNMALADLRRALWRASLVLAGTAAIITTFVLALPAESGRALLGESWDAAFPLVLPIGIAFCGAAVSGGAIAGLRARRQHHASFSTRVRVAPIAVAMPLLGAYVGAAGGYAWAAALAAWASAAAWWSALHRVLQEEDDT